MKQASSVLIAFGSISIVLAIIIFIYIFYSVIQVEVGYQISQGQLGVKELTPLDRDFGIVVPKISANAGIVSNVDPFSAKDYQLALTRGVAHAKGTALPGEAGNVFLFSHSSVNFLEANRYNSIFYLLDKLTAGDEIDLYYLNSKFKYIVTEKKIVNATDIKYLKGSESDKTVTLMTCWPAGTTYKRLLIVGKLSKD